MAPGSKPAIRSGARPTTRAGREIRPRACAGCAMDHRLRAIARRAPPGTVDGRRIDPESGVARAAGPAIGSARTAGALGSAGAAHDQSTGASTARTRPLVGRPRRARTAPAGPGRQHPRPVRLGALAGVLRPHRWLPAPPEHPLGRDARDGGPAHRHRAARARDDARPGRRPVRQARRRDAQADQARPARPGHARRDRRDPPAHRARLRGLPRPRPPARGHPRGLRDAPGGRHGGRLPGREPGPDADAPQEPATEPRRPGGRGRDHPARPDPGQRRPPVPAPQAGPRAGDLPPPDPRPDPRATAWASSSTRSR